jgi:GH18 family chitinase
MNCSAPWPARILIAALVSLACVRMDHVGLATADAPPPEVRFEVGNVWEGGYGASIQIRNRGAAPIVGWTLAWNHGPTIASLWNGTHSVDGIHHTVQNAGWNATIAAGAAVTLGFTGAGTMTDNVTDCRLSGAPCEVTYDLPPGWSGGASGGGSGGGGAPQVEPRGPFWFPEDIDGNRSVNGADLAQVLSAWGSEGTPGPAFAADVNRDGRVDAVDLAGILAAWGPLTPERVIVGYWIEWGIYGRNYQPADTPFEKMTHLHYAFAKINPDFTIAPFDAYAALDRFYPGDSWSMPFRGTYRQINQVLKAQHPHLRTLISVGGWTLSGPFSDAALTPERRATFAQSCVDFIRTYGFDGVDIDWEYPVCCGLESNTYRPEDRTNFTLLLAEVRERLDAAGAQDGRHYLLAIAAPAGLDKIANQEPHLYHPSLDYMTVMTYDFFGAWDLTMTGHHAGVSRNPAQGSSFTAVNYNIETAIGAFLDAGVPAHKIVPGVPFYGRAWRGVPPTNHGLFQPATGVPPGTWDDWASGATGVNDFTQIRTFLQGGDYVRHWDPVAKAAWAYSPTAFGGHFISYDDVESIAVKGEMVRQRGLGGFMFWEVTGDREEILLDALVDELGGRR